MKHEVVLVGVIGNCICIHEQVREEGKVRAQPCTLFPNNFCCPSCTNFIANAVSVALSLLFPCLVAST